MSGKQTVQAQQEIDEDKERQIEHSEKLWTAATNFSQLCSLNRKFLLGKMAQTPYHFGPIDDETIPLVQPLLELHDFGLLTIGSQPYDHDFCYEEGTGWVERQQRPFVDFLMSGDDGQYLKFFQALTKRAEIAVRVSQIYPFDILQGSHKGVTVSRQRIAKRAKQLKKQQWVAKTGALCSLDLSGEDIFSLEALENSSTVDFSIAAKAWKGSSDFDLLALIKKVAVDCHLPRIA